MSETAELSLKQRVEREQKEKAHAWNDLFDSAVDAVYKDPNSTLKDLIEVIFIQGTLDRIAPLDHSIKILREKFHKCVWPGTRDDAELYWRIIYSMEFSKHAIEKNWSIAGMDYCLAVLPAIYPMLWDHVARFFGQEQYDNPNTNYIFNAMLRKVQERAFQELKNLELPYPDLDNLISWGAKGDFHGIPVKVDRICSDGSLWLVPAEKQKKYGKNIQKLGELTNYNGASPLQIHSEDFVLTT